MIPNITTLFRRHTSTVSKEASSTPTTISTPTHASFLHGAKNTQITGGSFAIKIIYKTISRTLLGLLFLALCGTLYGCARYIRGVNTEQREALWSVVEPLTSRAKEAPDILYHRVAMNAVLNAGGRAEDAKCHPGTREEVLGLIEQWMDTRDSQNRMMWLSGPAGGGKTAIMKTIAERSKDRDVHTINFFFFRGDPTRNSAQSFVATLLYQIIQLYPAAHGTVANILSRNPLILDASIQAQFDKLISPLSDLIRDSSPDRTAIVIAVDGLDECDVDAKHSQEHVLRALDGLVREKDSPFLAMVASRPEPHIQMAFKQLVSKASSIFLDDQYSPENDIRHFVVAEFDRIKASHTNAHMLPDDWPSESAVAAVVRKSSGQFIYAATVMRFLASSSAVPSLSLEMVQGIVPVARNSPFTHLDSVYSYILDQVEDREATLDLLSTKLHSDRSPPQGFTGPPACPPFMEGSDVCISMGKWMPPKPERASVVDILEVINPRYTETVVISCLTDLSAIAQLRDGHLVFYHASMADFLLDRSRSNLSYIDLDAFSAQIFPSLWRSAKSFPTAIAWNPFKIISKIQQTKKTPAMTHAILTVSPSQFSNYDLSFREVIVFLEDISRLYYPHDLRSYTGILQIWTRWMESQDQFSHRTLEYWGYSYQIPFLLNFVFFARWQKWTAFIFDVIHFLSQQIRFGQT